MNRESIGYKKGGPKNDTETKREVWKEREIRTFTLSFEIMLFSKSSDTDLFSSNLLAKCCL